MASHFEILVVATLLLLPPRRCMPSSIYATNYEDLKMRGLAKSLQHEWVQVNISPHKMGGLCASTSSLQHPHFVGRPYILPGCLISILSFSKYESCLHAPTLLPQKKHHFVRTCCPAISLRFSQLSLRSNPSCSLQLQEAGLTPWGQFQGGYLWYIIAQNDPVMHVNRPQMKHMKLNQPGNKLARLVNQCGGCSRDHCSVLPRHTLSIQVM